MTFLSSIKRAIRLIKLDKNAAIELSQDNKSTLTGFIVIILVGLASAIWTLIHIVQSFSFSIFTSVYFYQIIVNELLAALISILLTIISIHAIAKIFKGKSGIKEYFRAQSHVYFPNIISSLFFSNITLLLYAVYLLNILASYTVVNSVHKIRTWQSVIAGIITVILYSIFSIIAQLLIPTFVAILLGIKV